MDSLKLLLLSFVQGATELLPVSSSGHLLLIGRLINYPVSTLFLTLVQIGTTLAVVFYLRNDIKRMFLSRNNRGLLFKILLSNLLVIIVAVVFEDVIEEKLRASWITSFFLIFWGVVMILVERFVRGGEVKIKDIPILKSFFVGSSQILALIPGTSRSAITTLAGISVGMRKFTAYKFSFLVGIPILLGSSAWSLLNLIRENEIGSLVTELGGVLNVSIIILVPFFVGYISVLLVEKFKKKNWLTVFGIYRVAIGILTLLLL
jgi:undecaprenyl-diphosphatase